MKKYSEKTSSSGEATDTSSPASRDSFSDMLNSLSPDVRDWWQVFEGMKGFPMHRREELMREFVAETKRSAMDRYRGESGSSRRGGQTKTSNELWLPTRVTMEDPLRRIVSRVEMIGAINKIGLASGHVVSKDRAVLLADMILKGESWTVAELDYAEALIVTDRELTRQISFERTVGPGVFAAAKEYEQVKRGRLHRASEVREYAEDKSRPIGDFFEIVVLDETNEKRWRMR